MRDEVVGELGDGEDEDEVEEQLDEADARVIVRPAHAEEVDPRRARLARWGGRLRSSGNALSSATRDGSWPGRPETIDCARGKALSPGRNPLQSIEIRIGTRGSPLALAQANETRRRLAAALSLPEAAIVIVPIRTTGDRITDRPLIEAGGKGLFTKEIDEALLAGDVDIAVHSAKDLPTALPDGIAIAATLPREDTRDALLSPKARSLADLPEGAVLGTSSLRRRAMALRLRPDLKVVDMRGNVETRIRKLDEGLADATILAMAGLNRLGLADRASGVLEGDGWLPAVAQGTIAIAARAGDAVNLDRAGADRPSRDVDRAPRRTGVPRRARRLVPDADRRARDARRRRPVDARHHRPAGRLGGPRSRPSAAASTMPARSAPRSGRSSAGPAARASSRGEPCVSSSRGPSRMPGRPRRG